MAARTYDTTVAMTHGPLAGIPATIERVLARLASGDLLITIRFAQPVLFRRALVERVDVRRSEVA
jgi:hypothetical protein